MKKYNIHIQEKQLTVLVTKADNRIAIIDDPIADSDAEEIATWVSSNGLGRRTAYDRWKLNSKQAISMFLLKWG